MNKKTSLIITAKDGNLEIITSSQLTFHFVPFTDKKESFIISASTLWKILTNHMESGLSSSITVDLNKSAHSRRT